MMANLKQIKDLMNVVQNAGNPTALLNTMMQRNPQIKQAMDFINENGGDPKAAFYKLAEQKGVDPEEVLKELR